ncbi:MAG: T9SS type A sorting domain-containing protein, partial [Ignavibacteria bacterium]|nr:T9SS type A sorting domain-containing protein [Ignavibacteria bacterium]
YTMMNDPRGYSHLNFRGIRVEFDKRWADSLAFENAEGWIHLSGTNGAVQYIHNKGWSVGLEFNHPFAVDEWAYERRIIRTAQKCIELNLNLDFVVLHTDEAGGEGRAIPYDVPPENRLPNEAPSFSSVLNKLYDFYKGITSINIDRNIPKDFYLGQNYPNPFNSNTTIEFEIPKRSNIRLVIYDIHGKEITVLLENKEFLPGKYEFSWNAEGLASSVYFYKLETEGFSSSRKLILVK